MEGYSFSHSLTEYGAAMDFFCPRKGTSLSGFSSFIFVSVLSNEFFLNCDILAYLFFSLGDGIVCYFVCVFVCVSASEPSLFTFARNRGGAVKGFFFFLVEIISTSLYSSIYENSFE